MSDSFRVSVRCDGESRVLPLDELLAENEGAPAFCEKVRALQPGEAFTFGAGATVRRFTEGQRRRTKVRVLLNFKGKATWATLTIDRKSGLMSVRLFRRRKAYELRTVDVAEIIIDRVARADAGLRRTKARRH